MRIGVLEGEQHALVAKLQQARPFPGAERILTIEVCVLSAPVASASRAPRTPRRRSCCAEPAQVLYRIQREFHAALQPLTRAAAPMPF